MEVKVLKQTDMRGRFGYSVLFRALSFALLSTSLLPLMANAEARIESGQTVTVPGTYGSPWDVPGSPGSGDLFIMGKLIISDRGVVNSAGGGVWGRQPDEASVLVTGTGSVWNSRSLNMGANSSAVIDNNAMVAVENGGVINSIDARVGYASALSAPSNAQVTIRGVGSTWNTDNLQIGGGRVAAKVQILGGGVLNTKSAVHVGGFNRQMFATSVSRSSVKIDGAGSRWNSGGEVTVTRASQIAVSNGAVLSAPVVSLTRGIEGSHPSGDTSFFSGGLLTIGGMLTDEVIPQGAATAPGTLDVSAIKFDQFGGGVVAFNHTATDYVFAPKLEAGALGSANNRILVFGGSTRFTADNSGFGGETSISGGRLQIDGALGGLVTVNTSGTLAGNGKVGQNLTVNQGGILSPGTSVGTLSVGGNLRLESGSIYRVEVMPQAADRVSVDGSTTIVPGALLSISPTSLFRPFTEYTILSAGTRVNGTFTLASDSSAFLDAIVTYGPQSVTLKLERNQVGFADLGVTANQRAAAAGVESAAGTPVWTAFALLNETSARAALDQLSGEIHASTQSALLEDGLELREAALGRLRETSDGAGVWLKGFGRQADINGDANAAQLDRDSYGVLLGTDMPLGDAWRFGGLIGAGRTRNDIDRRVSHSESRDRYVGLYASGQWENGLRLRAGVSYAQYDIDVRRNLNVPGLAAELTGTTDANSTQIFGELGYAWEAGSFDLEPFLGLAQIKLDTDAYGEQGGVGALQIAQGDSTARYATLGLRLGRDLGNWRFNGALAWRRASGDLAPESRLSFDGGTSFFVAGAPIARDAAVVEAGIAGRITDRVSLSASYLGQLASDANDHGASVKLSVNF